MSTTNVTSLLLEREIGGRRASAVSERERGLQEWVTNEASRHCLSECCALNNTPRSTIAATVNRDGTLVASTHGDHTVKLVDFQTGEFVKELTGHRRTPWTVKFHPLHPNLLVSGSLDYKIKLWDTDLGVCLQSRDFGRQITSVSFHPSGKALAIAAGHKLHLWEFDEEEGRFDKSSCIFHSSRTIRTVHFSPAGPDMIMVSERVEPSSITQEVPRLAPRPAAEYVRMMHPPQVAWNDYPQDRWIRGAPGLATAPRGSGMGFSVYDNHAYVNSSDSPHLTGVAQGYFSVGGGSESRSSDAILRQMGQMGQFHPPVMAFPSYDILPAVRAGPSDDTLHQVPDPQRLPGQQQAVPSGSSSARIRSNNPRPLHIAHPQTLPVLSLMPPSNANVEITRTGRPSEIPRAPPMIWNQHPNAMLSMPPTSNGNDMPHVTKLVLYKFDIDRPHLPLAQELMKIDSAVICSEMGAHISPCGRMMVVCEAFPSLDRRVPGLPAFLYELRVISLEKQNFGQVLRSRAISAGHCLTSVQFSPGSDMILLSYGRKHASLLRCLELNGATVAQIHTLLELYSAKTLALVRVMHSAEDEANTASFHPFAGEGIIYGTKNGKLRILRHKRTHSNGDGGEIKDYENELLEVLEDELE